MADDYSAEDFRSAEGETFELDADGRTITLTLDYVQDLPPGIREQGSFRLVFRGPAEPIVAQGLYGLARGGETYDIFLVPIAQNDQGSTYEAIFN